MSFFNYVAETFDSVANRQNRNQEVDNAMRDITDFINSQRPQIPNRPDLPGVPDFERQTVTERTDDELRELAENKLSGERLAQERAIDTQMQNRERDLGTQRENATTSAQEKKDATQASFERASQFVNNDALRRGLARSSIAVNRQSDLAEQSATQQAAIAHSLTRKIEGIENEISSLAGQRDQAIADFNVQHAARLAQQIHTLRQEQDRAVRDAAAFNNNVAEQERRAAIEQQERGAALHQRELDILARERELTGNNNDVFNHMVTVLRTLGATDARREVMENPIFRDNLSAQQFYRLFDMFTR